MAWEKGAGKGKADYFKDWMWAGGSKHADCTWHEICSRILAAWQSRWKLDFSSLKDISDNKLCEKYLQCKKNAAEDAIWDDDDVLHQKWVIYFKCFLAVLFGIQEEEYKNTRRRYALYYCITTQICIRDK